MNPERPDLAAAAAQALDLLREADAERLRAVEAAYRQHLRAGRAASRLIRELRARFDAPALTLACDCGIAPRMPNGQPRAPDAVAVQEAGLRLRWVRAAQADVEFLASWQALQDAEFPGKAPAAVWPRRGSARRFRARSLCTCP